MIGQLGETGFLKISNAEDRTNVASILFKNGYTVSTVRRKKNGKAYEYFVKYKITNQDIGEEV